MNAEQYLKEAEKILIAEGFSDMSMDRLAFRTGTTKRTLYNNFESRDDLFRCLTDMQRERIRSATLPLFSIYGMDAAAILAQWYTFNIGFLTCLGSAYLPSLKESRPLWHAALCDMLRQNCNEFMALLIPRGRQEGIFARNFDIDSYSNLVYRTMLSSGQEYAGSDILFLTQAIRKI